MSPLGIMAFTIRVGFGNCSVVRLICVVPVLFEHHTCFHTHAQRHQHTHADLHEVAHIPCVPYVFTSPSCSHSFQAYLEKSWHRERRGKAFT